MKARIIGILLAVLVASSGAARAGEPSTDDKALALALFRQARELMDAHAYDDACPKFEESQRLDPGGGTLLNLAVCHEAQKRVATAWAELSDALAVARRDGRADRVRLAEEHIAALEPRLPRLVVMVTREAPGLVVTRDRKELPRAAWSVGSSQPPVSIPVDPGDHVLEARVGDVIAAQEQVTAVEGQTRNVILTIPPEMLGASAAQVGTSAPAEQPARDEPMPSRAPITSPWRTVGWALLGGGALSVGTGSYFGLRAFGKQSESDDGCPRGRCTDAGAAASRAAGTAADVATATLAFGVVAVAAGIFLVVSHPPPGSSAPRRAVSARARDRHR